MKSCRIITFCLPLFAFFCPVKSKGQSISGTVNRYFKITAAVPAYNAVRVQDLLSLTTGDRVLIIQMKGAEISTDNSSTFGDVSNGPLVGGAGLYEFATICGFLNDTVLFEHELLNTYDFAQHVQLVYVPVYTNVTVAATLTADPWNPSTGLGGIVAIEASGTITLSADISAAGSGYRGGELLAFPNCNFISTSTAFSYSLPGTINANANGAAKGEGINSTLAGYEGGKGKQSNGGGGGNNHNTGGGGGANYGTGGNGGNYIGSGSFACNGTNAGIGGLTIASYGYTSANNRIFPGGGGGSGHENNPEGTPGGNGGGIVFIKCTELIGNNRSILANGTQGLSTNSFNVPPNEARGDGGGGGGGGGVVLLDIATYTTAVNVSAAGANGSNAGFQAQCPGPGGGGGGGVIWSSTPLPVQVNTNVTGGANGTVRISATHDPACEGLASGATAGTAGVVLSDLILPEGSVFNCYSNVLAVPLIKEWGGKRSGSTVVLNWKLEHAETVNELQLERKLAGGDFQQLQNYPEPADGYFQYKDLHNEEPATYRISLRLKSGVTRYSTVRFIDRVKRQLLNIYPNPAQLEVRIQLPKAVSGKAMVVIVDYSGRQVLTKEMLFYQQSIVTLPIQQLATGTYLIQIYCNNEFYTGRLIKE
jgi:hypothetical protein